MLKNKKKIDFKTIGSAYGTWFALLSFFLLLVIFYFYLEKVFYSEKNVTTQINDGVLYIHVPLSKDGHFRMQGTINDKRVVFMLDTGATLNAIGEELATELKIKSKNYGRVQTANGSVKVRYGTINKIVIDGVVFKNLATVILPNHQNEVLLGMDFLKRFDWEQKSGNLILRDNKLYNQINK